MFVAQETLSSVPYSEVISTRKVRAESGTLYLELKCGNLFQQRVARLQTDQAHEITRLIRQYMSLHRREYPLCSLYKPNLRVIKSYYAQGYTPPIAFSEST